MNFPEPVLWMSQKQRRTSVGLSSFAAIKELAQWTFLLKDGKNRAVEISHVNHFYIALVDKTFFYK